MSRRPIGLASASEASSRALRTRGSVGVLRCLAFAARSPRRMRLPIPLLLLLPLACAAAGGSRAGAQPRAGVLGVAEPGCGRQAPAAEAGERSPPPPPARGEPPRRDPPPPQPTP